MRRNSRVDRGFTLIEVLITIVIVGVLAVSMGALANMIVQTTPTSEERLNQVRSLTGLSTWLPEDVSSTPPGGLDVSPTATSGCGLGNPGTNLLRAAWSDSGVVYTASYRYVAEGTGWTVQRRACAGSTELPVATLTDVLEDSPACPLAAGAKLVNVALETNAAGQSIGARLDVLLACQSVEIHAVSNNPAETLAAPATAPPPAVVTTESTTTTSTTTTAPPASTIPPTTVFGATTTSSTSTTSTSTTTSTTTTTIAPCLGGVILLVNPSPVNNGAKEDAAELNKDVTITISSSGNCPTLGLSFDPINPDGSAVYDPRWVSMQGGTTVTLKGAGGYLWKDGFHTINLLDGMTSAVTLATTQLKVT